MPSSIQKQIKKFRKDHDMTKADFGRLVGCQSNQIKMWEDGKYHPSLKNCYKICDIMNITIHEFLPLKYKDL
jgi:DNA-binding XRE family transcriptional regulator